MKIFDCFMFFDEDIILDLRLNILDQYVDHFIIVESIFNHKGEKRNLKFNLNNYSKFKKKIIYLVYEETSNLINKINLNDSEDDKINKQILNAYHRENGQRNYINKGLRLAKDDDLVLISDVDEIPNLKNLKLENIKEKLIFFKQEMFYYKFNLKLPDKIWTGTRACKKKYLKSPQWLRNIKNRKYPIYRLDAFFSEKKHINIKFIENGGWHFTNLKTAEEIKHKLKSYLHHIEYDLNPLTTDEINKIINEKKAIYDLTADQRKNKIGTGSKLEIYDNKKLPEYLLKNIDKYKNWIEK